VQGQDVLCATTVANAQGATEPAKKLFIITKKTPLQNNNKQSLFY